MGSIMKMCLMVLRKSCRCSLLCWLSSPQNGAMCSSILLLFSLGKTGVVGMDGDDRRGSGVAGAREGVSRWYHVV